MSFAMWPKGHHMTPGYGTIGSHLSFRDETDYSIDRVVEGLSLVGWHDYVVETWCRITSLILSAFSRGGQCASPQFTVR
jgi:hypothetical protein